jgi:hypothetical protein
LFVCGFDDNHDKMHRFETDWQRRQQNMLQAGTITTPEQIADITQMIITKSNWDGLGSNLHCESQDLFIGLKMV